MEEEYIKIKQEEKNQILNSKNSRNIEDKNNYINTLHL